MSIPSLSSHDHRRGDLNAPLQIIHYGDFECPYSATAIGAIEEAREVWGEELVVIFRHFPLLDIHPHALSASEAAFAASAQGRFWEMHDWMFDHQNQLQPNSVRQFARELGLDLARFDEEMANETYRAPILASIEAGRAAGAHGTPTFWINGVFHDNREGLWKSARLLPILESVTKI